MEAYITYDVSNEGQKEVKSGMQVRGYMDNWMSANSTYYLPNTSLWKGNTELSQALKDIQAVIVAVNAQRPANKQVKLERCMVVPAAPWVGIPGDSVR